MTIQLIEVGEGVKLECDLHYNSKAHYRDAALILVHPYKLLGGNMYDYVINELWKASCTRRNDFSLILRYNQRSVGRSDSTWFSFLTNWRGQDDSTDLLHLIEHISSCPTPNSSNTQPAKRRVVIVGYSFGAALGASVIKHPHVVGYIGISIPIGSVANILQTCASFDALCRANHIPRLFLMGENDQYTSCRNFMDSITKAGGIELNREKGFFDPRVFDGWNKESDASLFGKIFDDDDHFWALNCALMVEYCLEFTSKVILPGEG